MYESPIGGTFTLTGLRWGAIFTTTAIAYDATVATIESAIVDATVDMRVAVVTFEFDPWDNWLTYINGIPVAYHRGEDPRDYGPALMESLTREFSPTLLDKEIVA